jgi:type IV pilus assembly protein PilB
MPGITPPTTHQRRRLGDVLVDLGFAEREVIEAIVIQARETSRPVGEMLMESGAVSSDELARALADRNGLDHVDLNLFDVDTGAANLVSAAEARRFRALPIAFLDPDTILVATSNPANVLGLDDIAMTTGYKVRLAVASPEDIEAVIGQFSDLEDSVQEVDEETRDGEAGAQVIELRASAEEAPVV